MSARTLRDAQSAACSPLRATSKEPNSHKATARDQHTESSNHAGSSVPGRRNWTVNRHDSCHAGSHVTVGMRLSTRQKCYRHGSASRTKEKIELQRVFDRSGTSLGRWSYQIHEELL